MLSLERLRAGQRPPPRSIFWHEINDPIAAYTLVIGDLFMHGCTYVHGARFETSECASK